MNFNDVIMTLFFFLSLHFSSPTGSHGLHMSLASLWGSTLLHGAAEVVTPPPLITFDSQEPIKSRKSNFFARTEQIWTTYILMISIYWLLFNFSSSQGSPWQRLRGRTDLWEAGDPPPPPPNPSQPPCSLHTGWPSISQPAPSATSQAAPLLTVRSSAWLRARRRRCGAVSTQVLLHAAKNNTARLFGTSALRCGRHSLGSTLSQERLHSFRVQKKNKK